MLFVKYFNGEITFNQLVAQLNAIGIDTSDLKLNEDGTISWLGMDSIPSLNPEDMNFDFNETIGLNGTIPDSSSSPSFVNGSSVLDGISDEIKVFNTNDESNDEAVAEESAE